MEQATFQNGYLPKIITLKEEEKKVQEITKRIEDWKKKTLGGKLICH